MSKKDIRVSITHSQDTPQDGSTIYYDSNDGIWKAAEALLIDENNKRVIAQNITTSSLLVESNNNPVSIVIGNNSTSTYGALRWNINALQIYTNNYGYRLDINALTLSLQAYSSGGVAIGALSVPSGSKFYVNGTQSNAGDIEFTANTVGPVLIDRTTGTKYRLYVDNGVLSIETVA